MHISLDLSTVPPSFALHDEDNFKELNVVATKVEHGYIDVETLKALAGGRANDPEWQSNLEGMLAYAQKRGWVREDGAVRAHVEWHD